MSHHATQQATTVSSKNSLAFVRNMIRCSISTIAYLRGLCPEHSFRERKFASMKVRDLVCTSDESTMLVNWVEQGVVDAIQHKYLREMALCIYDGQCNELLESYVFGVSYGSKEDSDGIQLALMSGSGTTAASQARTVKNDASQKKEEVTEKKKFASFSNMNVNNNKNTGNGFKSEREMVMEGVQSLFDPLVQTLHCLDALPQSRCLTMRIAYYDDITPEEYQPPFFAPASRHMRSLYYSELASASAFTGGKLQKERQQQDSVSLNTVELGDVGTRYHMISFAIRRGNKRKEEEGIAMMRSGNARDDVLGSYKGDSITTITNNNNNNIKNAKRGRGGGGMCSVPSSSATVGGADTGRSANAAAAAAANTFITEGGSEEEEAGRGTSVTKNRKKKVLVSHATSASSSSLMARGGGSYPNAPVVSGGGCSCSYLPEGSYQDGTTIPPDSNNSCIHRSGNISATMASSSSSFHPSVAVKQSSSLQGGDEKSQQKIAEKATSQIRKGEASNAEKIILRKKGQKSLTSSSDSLSSGTCDSSDDERSEEEEEQPGERSSSDSLSEEIRADSSSSQKPVSTTEDVHSLCSSSCYSASQRESLSQTIRNNHEEKASAIITKKQKHIASSSSPSLRSLRSSSSASSFYSSTSSPTNSEKGGAAQCGKRKQGRSMIKKEEGLGKDAVQHAAAGRRREGVGSVQPISTPIEPKISYVPTGFVGNAPRGVINH